MAEAGDRVFDKGDLVAEFGCKWDRELIQVLARMPTTTTLRTPCFFS